MVSLNQVCTGVWTCVVALHTKQELTRRLEDFGLVPGTKICRRYSSPAGDVTALELRGSVLAMRTTDVRRIMVHIL